MAEGSGELMLLCWDLADINLRASLSCLFEIVQTETKDLSCNPSAVQEMLKKCLCLPRFLSLQLLNIEAILFQLYPNTSLFWRSHKENY